MGALLRQQQPAAPAAHIAFDEAGTSWLAYRKQTCASVFATYAGGSGAAGAELSCQLTVTRTHMKELVAIQAIEIQTQK